MAEQAAVREGELIFSRRQFSAPQALSHFVLVTVTPRWLRNWSWSFPFTSRAGGIGGCLLRCRKRLPPPRPLVGRSIGCYLGEGRVGRGPFRSSSPELVAPSVQELEIFFYIIIIDVESL